MLVLSREIGESLVIEDVALTLVTVGGRYAEVSLVKLAGGKTIVVALPYGEYVDICYDARVVLIRAEGTKARLGFEAPEGVLIRRRELIDE